MRTISNLRRPQAFERGDLGVLYNDINGNGKQDSGEAGLKGLTVYIDANHNGKLDSGEKTATTSTTGAYSFTGLAAGTYVIGEVVPSGYKQTTKTAGGKVGVATLHDYELNGSYSDADHGSSLVPDGGKLSSTGYTFAAAQGLSLSKALPVDSYSIEMLVTLKAPSGYQKLIDFKNRTADAGVYALANSLVFFDGASSNTVAFTAGKPVDIVLTRNSSTKQVIGYVNGLQVFTFADTGSVATFSASNAVGWFLMDDLVTNHEYPSGFLDRLQIFDHALSSTDVKAVDAGGYSVGTNEYVVKLTTSNASGISFGDQKVVVPPTNLKGVVFNDSNGNGTKDSGESVIAGATVYLDTNDNGKFDAGEKAVKTASDGSYDFVGLAAGSYHVAVVPNTGYVITDPKITGAVLSHDYALAGKLTDGLGGPSLVSTGGKISSSGYTFGTNQGLSLSSGLTSDNYSIELHFEIADVTGYRKIIDFKNRTADAGLYVLNGALTFFGQGVTGTANAIADNKIVDVILTRNSSTKTVVGYVNGVQQFSFVDSSSLATFSSSSNIAWFFDDDLATNHEYGTGTVKHIRTFAGALSAAQAKSLANGGTPPTAIQDYTETLAAGQSISSLNFGERKIS